MRYIEDFLSKWGFSDGDSIPPDAHEQRTVAVHALNKAAEALGIPARAFACNRGGMHNDCVIGFVKLEHFVPDSDPNNPPYTNDQFAEDEVMAPAVAAVECSEEFVATDLVLTKCSLADGWQAALDEAIKLGVEQYKADEGEVAK